MNETFSALNPDQRYAYLIEEVQSKNEIWLLQTPQGLYAMFEDNAGVSYLPVWPDSQTAALFATDDWEDYSPARMGLPEWLEWMKELKNDQIIIGAFPDAQLQVLAVDPLEFRKVLSGK